MVNNYLKTCKLEPSHQLVEELRQFFEKIHIYLNKENTSHLSSYRTDGKLYRMKEVYETLFPWTKQGGYMKTYRKYNKNKLLKKSAIPLAGLQSVWASIKPNVSFIKQLKSYVPVADTIDPRKIPSFVRLVSSISKFSISTIKNRIQAYTIVLQKLIDQKFILEYATGVISYSSILRLYTKRK